jgi:hypothetical protein
VVSAQARSSTHGTQQHDTQQQYNSTIRSSRTMRSNSTRFNGRHASKQGSSDDSVAARWHTKSE